MNINLQSRFRPFIEEKIMDIGRYSPIEGQVDFIDQITNNNTHILYKLVTSMNYIVLNYYPPAALLDQYKNFLEIRGFVNPDKPEEGKTSGHNLVLSYECKDTVAYDGEPLRLKLFCEPRPKERKTKSGKMQRYTPQTGITTKVWYPTKELYAVLLDFFSSNLMPKISEIEFTFDFYTEQREALRNFFYDHRFTKYNRGKPFAVKDTIYSTKREKGKRVSKGMKTYPKDAIYGSPVRMELTLKRTIIGPGNLNLELPTLDKQIQELDFSRFFDFRTLDVDGWQKKLTERDRRAHFKKSMLSNYPKRKRWTVENSMGLHQAHINSMIDYYRNDGDKGYKPRSLEEINSKLKITKENRQGIISKLDKFNGKFFGNLKGRSFLL